MIDTIDQSIQSTEISWSAASRYVKTDDPLLPLKGGGTAKANGATIVLPGVTKPCSYEYSSTELVFSYTHDVYGTIMVDCNRKKAIAWRMTDPYNKKPEWYLLEGETETLLNNDSHFHFDLIESEAVVPELGVYTFSGRILFWIGIIQTSYLSVEIDSLASSLVGTNILWSVLLNNGNARRAYGRVTAAIVNGTAVTSITVAVERIVDLPYSRHASRHGTIVSRNGSLGDFLYGMGNFSIVGIGKMYPGYGFAADMFTNAGYELTSFTGLTLNFLNYHWKGQNIYIPNDPIPTATENTTNYAEVWTIDESGNFFLKDTLKKAKRFPLAAAGEAIDIDVAGSYIS